MNTSLVAGYLPGIASKRPGEAKAPTTSMTSEWTSALTSIALRQQHVEESVASAWVMISTIFGCMAIMLAVVIAAATSMA